MQASPDAPALCMTSLTNTGDTNLYIDDLGAGVINKIGPLSPGSTTYKEIAFRKHYVLAGQIECIGIMQDTRRAALEMTTMSVTKRPNCFKEMTLLLHEPSTGAIHVVKVKYST